MGKPDKTVRISVIQPLDDGTVTNQDVGEGTKVGDYIACYLEKNEKSSDGLVYKVNRQAVDEDYVLQQGDRLSLFFGNIAAAGD